MHLIDSSAINNVDCYYEDCPLLEKLNIALQQIVKFSDILIIDETVVRCFSIHGCI